eukprot:UN01779
MRPQWLVMAANGSSQTKRSKVILIEKRRQNELNKRINLIDLLKKERRQPITPLTFHCNEFNKSKNFTIQCGLALNSFMRERGRE